MVDLLAGECTSSEEMKIRSHLLDCGRCARELEEFQALDGLLDILESDQAPPGLRNSIMEAVAKESEGAGDQAADPQPGGRPELLRRPRAPGMLRDMAAAAAAVLAFLWLGAGWLGPLAATTESRVSGAVVSYVRFTGATVERAQVSMSLLNSDLLSTADRLSLPKNYRQGSDQR